MWYVYLIQCEDKSIYTGMTNNYVRRFLRHKSGRGARYTQKHKPEKLIYFEILKTRSAAMKREAEIKSLRREKKLDLIKCGNPSASSEQAL